jgi:hypothetical protein
MIADSIISLVMIMIITVLFYGPWQVLCAGIARQLIFERRNLIFNFARRGDLDFNSKEYRDIRNSLNLMIRFAHQATLPRLLFISLCLYKKPVNETSQLQAAASRVTNPKMQIELHRIINEVETIMMFAAMCRSIYFWVCLPLSVMPAIIVWCLRASLERTNVKKIIVWLIRNFGERVQIEAECAECAE